MDDKLINLIDSEIEKARAEGQKYGITLAHQYHEWCEKVSKGINRASKESDLNRKRNFLRGIMTHMIYQYARENPSSKRFAKMKDDLEKLAEENGFVMTNQGVYLDNMPS